MKPPQKMKGAQTVTNCFMIPGKPQGKARPRFSGGVVYTPASTKRYEQTVRQAYISATDAAQRFYEGAVSVQIDAIFPIPKHWKKADREKALAGELPPEVKPDGDNIAKAVLDALNGLAYKDDSQVVELTVHKRYGVTGRVIVRIDDFTEEPAWTS